jgi:DNA polymerase III epsilon subunit-like protein
LIHNSGRIAQLSQGGTCCATPLIFVDCEAYGHCPALGKLTEFGAVVYPSRASFHGILAESEPSQENPAIPRLTGKIFDEKKVFENFEKWIREVTHGARPVFVSDNPAFDWQWINDGFWRTLGRNPFGHSARRISDFYAGLMGDFGNTQSWKKLRITPHDHNPVHDAIGNLEAFERLLRGER